jgi:hypothetical protein
MTATVHQPGGTARLTCGAAALVLLSAGAASANTCGGSSPRVGWHFVSPNVPGERVLRITWRYNGPEDCKDLYNVRWAVIDRGGQQVEVGGADCPQFSVPERFCRHDVTVNTDEPYRFMVQTCDERFLEASSCSA